MNCDGLLYLSKCQYHHASLVFAFLKKCSGLQSHEFYFAVHLLVPLLATADWIRKLFWRKLAVFSPRKLLPLCRTIYLLSVRNLSCVLTQQTKLHYSCYVWLALLLRFFSPSFLPFLSARFLANVAKIIQFQIGT